MVATHNRLVDVWHVDGYSDVSVIHRSINDFFDRHSIAFSSVCSSGKDALVVIKPNWVQEAHEYQPEVWEPVITNPALVLAVIEAVAARMRGFGTICVCDGPNTYANFEAILKRGYFLSRLEQLREKWAELSIEILDLRREIWERRDEVIIARRPNTADPRGYVRVNLGRHSHFYGGPGEGHYYGADYDTAVVNEHHRGERQEYLFAGSPMKCDLFINLPKLKTHKKTGITCCLKNLVGVNGDKNWLPHHTRAGSSTPGDEFPMETASVAIERFLKRVGQRLALSLPGLGTWVYRKLRNRGKAMLGDSQTTIRNGDWRGNDTCWRMALDLNRAFLHTGSDGLLLTDGAPRKYLAIVDGIVGGQGNGPLCPDPVESHVLIGGTNPAAVDAVASRLMGFDPGNLPLVRHAFDPHPLPIASFSLDCIRVIDHPSGAELGLTEVEAVVPGGFRPHFGWRDVPRIAGCHSIETEHA